MSKVIYNDNTTDNSPRSIIYINRVSVRRLSNVFYNSFYDVLADYVDITSPDTTQEEFFEYLKWLCEKLLPTFNGAISAITPLEAKITRESNIRFYYKIEATVGSCTLTISETIIKGDKNE